MMELKEASDRRNISRVFEKQTNIRKTALVYYGRKFSYEEVGKLARQFAQAFMRLGVRRGDRVALMMSNVPQFVFAYYGAMLAGAIVTPVNLLNIPRSYRAQDKNPAVPEDIKTQIHDAAPSLIVAFDFYFPLIEKMQEELSGEGEKAKVLITGPQDFMPAILKRLAPIKLKQDGRWIKIEKRPSWLYDLMGVVQEEEKKIANFDRFPGIEADENEVAQLQYTGGTTGTPKGVMLTHRNLLSNISQAKRSLEQFLSDNEVVLGVLPFFHIYGLTVAMQITLLELGGTLVLVADPHDVKQWVSWAKEHRVTIIPSVPRLYERFVGAHRELLEEKPFSSVKFFLNGAGVLPPKTRRTFEELSGARILEGYGLSEASPIVSVSSPERFKKGSIGIPAPDTEVRIADPETGDSLPAGQDGEIVVRGPQVMAGYWQKPDETARILRDGWLHTGDMGHMDEEGFLYMTDRIKDMAKINGENVFPSKVEKVLTGHPAVKEATVVGMPDQDQGERLVACVALQDANMQSEEVRKELVRHASETLAPFEVPREIIFVGSLDPYKNQLGKILKRQIRQALKSGKL